MKDIKKFELIDDDYYAIDIAMNTVRNFLKSSKITSKQVIGLGNALYALERLPIVTDCSHCEFGISYEKASEEYSETFYLSFTISDYLFSISQGGSVYDKAIGGDTFSDPKWEVEVGGYYHREGELCYLEDRIKGYLNMGGKITVSDESNIECRGCGGVSIQMNAKDKIIRKIAENACDKIARRVVRKLQQMTKGRQSGDDSSLKNTWDEICVQVQYEESIMWDFYLDIILSLIEDDVKTQNVEIKQCIWLQTEAAIDWEEEDDEEREMIEFDEEDIANYVLQDFILSMASNWKNKRIERYLEREPESDW